MTFTAKEAGANIRSRKTVVVDLDILDAYIMSFAEKEEDENGLQKRMRNTWSILLVVPRSSSNMTRGSNYVYGNSRIYGTRKRGKGCVSHPQNSSCKYEKIESIITEEPNLTRDTIVEISNSNGTIQREIDFSDTLRVLGVNPDSLPTIEKIIEARKESEERQD